MAGLDEDDWEQKQKQKEELFLSFNNELKGLLDSNKQMLDNTQTNTELLHSFRGKLVERETGYCSERAALESALSQFQTENQSLQKQVMKLQDEHEALRDKFSQLTEEFDKISASHKKLTEQLEESVPKALAEQWVQEEIKRAHSCEQQYQASQSKCRQLEEEIAEKSASIASLTEQLQGIVIDLSERTEQLSNTERRWKADNVAAETALRDEIAKVQMAELRLTEAEETHCVAMEKLDDKYHSSKKVIKAREKEIKAQTQRVAELELAIRQMKERGTMEASAEARAREEAEQRALAAEEKCKAISEEMLEFRTKSAQHRADAMKTEAELDERLKEERTKRVLAERALKDIEKKVERVLAKVKELEHENEELRRSLLAAKDGMGVLTTISRIRNTEIRNDKPVGFDAVINRIDGITKTVDTLKPKK